MWTEAAPENPRCPITIPQVSPTPADSLSLDMVTAALRDDSGDIAIYARCWTESLGESLPPDCVAVELGSVGVGPDEGPSRHGDEDHGAGSATR